MITVRKLGAETCEVVVREASTTIALRRQAPPLHGWIARRASTLYKAARVYRV